MVMTLQRRITRTFRENKAQYLSAFFMVMISSMLFVGMNLVANNLRLVFDTFAENSQLEDAQFAADSELAIADLENQFNARIEQSGVADFEVEPGQTLRIFPANEKLNRYALLEGNALDDNSILLDPLFAKAHDLAAGDSLVVAGQEYTVAGTMVLPNYIYIIRSREELINDPATFGIAVVSQANFAALPGTADFYSIRFANRANIHQQEIAFRNGLLTEGVAITRWDSTENNSKVTYVTLEITTLSTMSTAVPGMLIILSIVLIGILLKRMMQRETAVIGTFYALGYRQTELLRHYLMYPLIVGGTGGILGALLGILIGRLIFSFMLSVFTMPVAAFHYNFIFLTIGILLPVVVLVVTSYFAVVNMLGLSPAELMKGTRVSEKVNIVERAIKLDRFSFGTKFQIREQVRSLSRTGFLLFGIIVATILLLYGMTLQSSLDYMLDEGIAALYNLKYEYVYNDVRTEAPPAGFEPFNGFYVTPQADSSVNFAIIGALPQTTRLRLKDPSGNKLIPDRVIITSLLADKLHIGVGDVLRVTSDDDLKEYSLTIEAVADSAAGEFVFMPLEHLNAMLGMPAISYIGIWGDEVLEFPKGILASSKSMDAVAAGIRNLISQSGVLVYTMIGMSFILGLIIIFLVTGMIIEENRTTISLFKVLGYQPKEINRLILNSNTAVVILGYLLGIPLLLLSVSALMQNLTESMQMTIPVRLNVGFMLVGFVVVFVTYQTALLLSRKKIDRILMGEALKAGTE